MSSYHDTFLNYLSSFRESLPITELGSVEPDPARIAVICVDLINGFCNEGALASPRVRKIIEPIVTLFDLAHRYGVQHFILTQDTHEPDAVEFGSFPPHCIRGTLEAETVAELKALPFFSKMTIIEKNSIHSGLNTGLAAWMNNHSDVDVFIIVGDCTDLCIYQLAMFLKLDANAKQKNRRVIVPENCVDTYDMSVKTASEYKAFPHDAEIIHDLFLYHMALNGIEIVGSIK